MANFVRSESIVSLNCCKDSEVMDIPRCYYTKWAGDDNVKEDLIILENLYPQVRILFCLPFYVMACAQKRARLKIETKHFAHFYTYVSQWLKIVKKYPTLNLKNVKVIFGAKIQIFFSF